MDLRSLLQVEKIKVCGAKGMQTKMGKLGPCWHCDGQPRCSGASVVICNQSVSRRVCYVMSRRAAFCRVSCCAVTFSSHALARCCPTPTTPCFSSAHFPLKFRCEVVRSYYCSLLYVS